MSRVLMCRIKKIPYIIINRAFENNFKWFLKIKFKHYLAILSPAIDFLRYIYRCVLNENFITSN